MVCAADFYLPYGGGQIDAYDPGLAAAYNTNVAAFNTTYSSFFGHSIWFSPEEGDDPYGLNRTDHEDLGYIIAAHNPSVSEDALGTFTYTDQTLYAKLALRNFLTNEYGTIAALNAAWGTSYTTFDTSDPNGDTGISNGSYSSYGTGTGLLDENGSHILASGWLCSEMASTYSWSATPAIEGDLHNFVGQFAGTYAQKLIAAWNQISPRPPVFMPLYDPPSYVAAAIAPYLNNGDGLWIAPDSNPTEVQNIINALGPNKPVIAVDYTTADPDSPMSAIPCPQSGPECQATQAARGNQMVSYWQQVLHLKDANGRYTVVGIEHWGFYDQTGQGNFGLVTADQDNPYDGSADTANGEPGNYGNALEPIETFLTAGICD